jgi:M6 family metalloprotease-like protein
MKKAISLLILIFYYQNLLLAVTAYPYPIEINQMDGSNLTIVQKGDEYFSWEESTDGLVIMRNNIGVFEYANIDATGKIIPSGTKVNNVEKRSAIEKQFIFSTSQPQIREYLIKQQDNASKQKVLSTNVAAQSAPITGTRKVLCILIGFTDRPFTKTSSEFNNLMNQAGYNVGSATGSVKDYYSEVSYGKLNLDITVVGPYTANHGMAYYGANSGNSKYIRARDLITEAVQKANPNVNYAEYDYDNDGAVDVHVIFAGYDEAAGGQQDAIWSHKGNIPSIILDGKQISTYSCSSELRGNSGNSIAPIGTVCHELGHVLNAPNMYDVLPDTVDFTGTGQWDLMAVGSWNGPWNAPGDYPAHLNPYTKSQFGWITINNLPSDNALVTLQPAHANNNSFYRMNTATSGEYFILENRQWSSFDYYLPGHGLLIWHVHSYIESDRYAINTAHPQRLYPVCASATQNPGSTPNSYGTINSSGCSFPGSLNKRSFASNTIPSATSWAGVVTGKNLHFITETSNKTITFVINPTISGPAVVCPNTEVAYTVAHAPAGYTWTCSSNLTPVAGKAGVFITNSTAGSAWIKILYNGIELASKTISVGTSVGINGPDYITSAKTTRYTMNTDCYLGSSYKWVLYKQNYNIGLGERPDTVFLRNYVDIVSTVQSGQRNAYVLKLLSGNEVLDTKIIGVNGYKLGLHGFKPGRPELRYNNPVDDELSISFEDEMETVAKIRQMQSIEVVLYDTYGQVLRRAVSVGESIRFETSDLQDGLYYLHVIDRNDANAQPIRHTVIVKH